MNFDILCIIASKLDDKDLSSLGTTNKYFYERIYKRDRIWLEKLKHYDSRFDKFNKSPKDLYNLLKDLMIIKNCFNTTYNLFKLYNSENFYLYRCEIEKIPKEIGVLSNLYLLRLEYNRIKEIPKELCNLFNLEFLDLHDNNITEIPKEIGNLTKLKYLNLNDNKIGEIPKELGNLSKLEALSLSNNKITEIPKEIGNLTNLVSLSLSNNEMIYQKK